MNWPTCLARQRQPQNCWEFSKQNKGPKAGASLLGRHKRAVGGKLNQHGSRTSRQELVEGGYMGGSFEGAMQVEWQALSVCPYNWPKALLLCSCYPTLLLLHCWSFMRSALVLPFSCIVPCFLHREKFGLIGLFCKLLFFIFLWTIWPTAKGISSEILIRFMNGVP